MTRAKLTALLALTALLVPIPRPVSAAPTTVKLATLVPDGSIWHNVLRDMGDDWTRLTDGRVALRIYPGGVAGDEPDMLRKMRIGQIHASALTVRGLAEIDDAFKVFTIPMLFESYDELYYVLDQMESTLKRRLEDKGFVLLNWGHAGWVYFFSKEPISSIDDLKKLKIWVWSGDEPMVQMWKSNGFQPVALAATDILTGLQTGMIDALPTVPLGALQLQWFRITNHMVDAGLAPLVGGLVISRKVWDKIPEADRAKVLQGCSRAEKRLEDVIPEQDQNAVVEMQKRGLDVTRLKDRDLERWRAETDFFAGKMRGSMVPPDILDLALRERDAFREQQRAKDRP